MPRPSTVSRLPSEIREKIGKLREAGHTIDEIMTVLDGLDVSRSALGRHVQKIDALGEKLRKTREAAEALIRKQGEREPTQQSQLLVELMQSFLMRVFQNHDGDPATLVEPKNFSMISGALLALARASKTDVEYQKSVEEAVRQKIMAEARENMEKVTKKRGISRETADALLEALGT